MIFRCKPCSFLQSITVAYAVTDDTSDTLVLTITDPCCKASDTKMIRAILLKALCTIVADSNWTFSSDPTGTLETCGGPATASAAVFDFSNKKLTLVLTTISGPAGSGNLTVAPPFADVA